MTDTSPIVIIGGGHAGAQLCAGLSAAGLGARVHLVCAEPEMPYQRPPLSKSYLKNPDEPVQAHRSDAWFAEAGITLHRGDAAVALDRTAQCVQLRSGRQLPYQSLVLATGTRARRLAELPQSLTNVAVLRTAADAAWLRGALQAASHLSVLGGGFIGLEIAATARLLGKAVTVLESAPRLLMRSVSPELAEHVLQTHRASGVDLRLGVRCGGFEIHADRLTGLSVDDQREAVELLLLGIGAEAETALAQQAGLACDNGVVVDAFMRTSDAAILAVGDCTRFPDPAGAGALRLESVQNANDQARTALATLQGQPQAYRALPWFWSDQGSLKLQMAGLMPADGVRHRRPGPTPDKFSLMHYVGERLACVESVNAPGDHLAARKLLEGGKNPPPALACDGGVPLKSWI